jgi:hypothetical protein
MDFTSKLLNRHKTPPPWPPNRDLLPQRQQPAAPVIHALPPIGDASQPSSQQIPAASAVAAPRPAAHTPPPNTISPLLASIGHCKPHWCIISPSGTGEAALGLVLICNCAINHHPQRWLRQWIVRRASPSAWSGVLTHTICSVFSQVATTINFWLGAMSKDGSGVH